MGKCTYCKRKMKDKWDYCPTCGTQVDKQISMFNLLKRQMDIMKNLVGRVDEDEPRMQEPRNAITIQINSSGMREPRVQVFPKPISPREDQNYVNKKSIQRKMPGTVVEPEMKVKRLAREMLFTIPLPDIKSGEDIELKILPDSVEIKAFGKKKGYFKILNIPKNYKLVEKSLNDENLNLKFAI